MKKELARECPFEYLTRKNSHETFSKEIVRNWYIARAFVLDKLKGISFAPDSGGHLHAVIDGDSPLMQAVVRQLALSAHYINFVEHDSADRLVCRNRTSLTLITQKDAADILVDLEKEENLCNLLKYCKHSVFGDIKNDRSFIDIELEIVKETPEKTDCIWITEAEVNTFVKSQTPEDLFSIDTRKAIYTNSAYKLGVAIDNLPYEDIFNASRYSRGLDTFQYRVLQDKNGVGLVEDSWKNDPFAAKEGLSNLFCSDCFESREAAIKRRHPHYEDMSGKEKRKLWEEQIIALSRSEHSRWCVEKLIMGYRPLNKQEQFEYGCLFQKKRAEYLKALKRNVEGPAHLDLCSFRDLRRIDPDNMKYDGFLVLAIPLILEKVR